MKNKTRFKNALWTCYRVANVDDDDENDKKTMITMMKTKAKDTNMRMRMMTKMTTINSAS